MINIYITSEDKGMNLEAKQDRKWCK